MSNSEENTNVETAQPIKKLKLEPGTGDGSGVVLVFQPREPRPVLAITEYTEVDLTLEAPVSPAGEDSDVAEEEAPVSVPGSNTLATDLVAEEPRVEPVEIQAAEERFPPTLKSGPPMNNPTLATVSPDIADTLEAPADESVIEIDPPVAPLTEPAATLAADVVEVPATLAEQALPDFSTFLEPRILPPTEVDHSEPGATEVPTDDEDVVVDDDPRSPRHTSTPVRAGKNIHLLI